MKNSLQFVILSIVYVLFLNVNFNRKKHVDTPELKIFGHLLYLNLLGLLIEFGSIIFGNVIGTTSFLSVLFNRLYLIYLVGFVYLFLNYVITISLGSKKYRENKKKYIVISIIIFIISSLLSLLLPIKIYTGYSTGPAITSVYASSGIAILISLFYMLKNIKKVALGNYLSLFILLGGLALTSIIQRIYPSFTLMTSMEGFVLLVMYHTIENPDVKMINELELAKKQAEKANAAKSDFLSSMSHEIRTPLNAIVGFSECIKQSDDIAEIHEDIDDVIKASQNLLEIVNGVLDISKIEADKLEIVNVSYNPVEVFNELVKLVSTRIGEKDLEIRCNFAPDIPEVLYGDKSKVKQIVLNLLTNAVKYTDKGYVDLSVSCINKDNKSDLSITVADTGRGIKEEQMSRLFNKFERLEEDRNTTIEGTGLGLAITKALVEMMGGKIIVHSTYGEGSKFTILISQKISTEGLDTEKKVDTSVNDFEGKKVLVVDDNRLNLRVVDKLLKSYKLNVTLIESGFECVNKIENNESYDLIFMDIMMPKMSGVETLKKLKSISRFNIPVVALTADAMEGKANKYIEVGFNDYLSKPIDKEELKRVLNKFLVKKEYSNEETRSTSGSNSDNKVYEAKITDDDIKMLDELLAKSKLEK